MNIGTHELVAGFGSNVRIPRNRRVGGLNGSSGASGFLNQTQYNPTTGILNPVNTPGVGLYFGIVSPNSFTGSIPSLVITGNGFDTINKAGLAFQLAGTSLSATVNSQYQITLGSNITTPAAGTYQILWTLPSFGMWLGTGLFVVVGTAGLTWISSFFTPPIGVYGTGFLSLNPATLKFKLSTTINSGFYIYNDSFLGVGFNLYPPHSVYQLFYSTDNGTTWIGTGLNITIP